MKTSLRNIKFVVVDLYSGKYVITNESGHEGYNLEEINDCYYGYCPPNGNVDILKLGAKRTDNQVDDIMVIYTKKLSGSSNRQIIAFCEKATAFKDNQDGKYLNRKIIINEKTQYCDYSIVSDHMYDLRGYYKKFIINLSQYSTYMFRRQRFYKGTYPQLDIEILDYLEEYLNTPHFVDDLTFQNEIQNISNAQILPNDSKESLSFTNGANGRQVRKKARISKAALTKANFMCEGDSSHTTFATAHGNQYMEGHHLIPCTVSNAVDFHNRCNNVNIDCIENIVSLCPTCHRLVHFGSSKERNILLEKLHQNRKKSLCKIGIDLSLEELIELYE